MLLSSAIELYAGGPGSGPNAPCPQCGPEGGRTFTGPKGGKAPKLAKDVGNIRMPKKDVPGHKQYLRYQERTRQGTKEMQQWKQAHHTEQPKTAGIKEGDKVKINVAVRDYYNTPPFGRDKVPGTKAIVVGVMPAFGGHPETLKVQYSPLGQIHRVPSSDVTFHKAAGPPLEPKRGIKSEPIPERQTLTRMDMPQGRYAIAKPAGEPGESRGPQNVQFRPHDLSGQFEAVDKVDSMFRSVSGHPNQDLKSWIYEAKREDGSGSVLMLHKYTDASTGKIRNTTLYEMNYKSGNYKYSSPKQFSYNNPALAFKSLRDRYGIQMKMKDWRS